MPVQLHKFCSNLDIVLEFSSSYHLSSNPAERAVRTVKNIMKKCADAKLKNSAWRIGLIEYLCAPISDQTPSLAKILNSHIYKGYQPFLFSSSRSESVTEKLVERGKEEKLYHDRSFSDKPVIGERQNVWYRNNVKNIWGKGTIVDRVDTSNRRYTLIGENGKILSHNHVDLKLCHTKVSHNLEAKPFPLIPVTSSQKSNAILSSTNARKSKDEMSV